MHAAGVSTLDNILDAAIPPGDRRINLWLVLHFNRSDFLDSRRNLCNE